MKVLRDITLEEVSRIFGPIVNRNGYSYVRNKDSDFIRKIETLWMIVHQKPHINASRLIPLGMVQRLTFEKVHGKNMKWAFYVEWTNNEQHWHKARVEQVEFLNDKDEGECQLRTKYKKILV